LSSTFHVTVIGSSRLIVLPLGFVPVALYVRVPEPGPGVDESTVTSELTLSVSVLFGAVSQLPGIAIVAEPLMAAPSPSPVAIVTERMPTLASVLFANT
jgi:hypothetical protein